MSDRPKLLAIDRAGAAAHLHGLLGAKEVPDAARRPTQSRRGLILVVGFAAICGIVVAGLWTKSYLEERARLEQVRLAELARINEQARLAEQARAKERTRLTEQERIEAQARTARADARSWDLLARALIENETSPDAETAPLLAPNSPGLRSPAQILRLHQQTLARQSGPAWEQISQQQRSKLVAILNTYIAAFERLQRARGLEDQLYCRRGLSLSWNLQPTEAPDQLNAMTDLPSMFARIRSALASVPPDAPKEQVRKLLSLTEARIQLIDQEIALLRFLSENARFWKAQPRNSDKVNTPIFANRALSDRLRMLTDTESLHYSALYRNVSQLVGPTLTRQLKLIR